MNIIQQNDSLKDWYNTIFRMSCNVLYFWIFKKHCSLWYIIISSVLFTNFKEFKCRATLRCSTLHWCNKVGKKPSSSSWPYGGHKPSSFHHLNMIAAAVPQFAAFYTVTSFTDGASELPSVPSICWALTPSAGWLSGVSTSTRWLLALLSTGLRKISQFQEKAPNWSYFSLLGRYRFKDLC